MEENYTIWFVTGLDHSGITISLTALVEVNPRRSSYLIKNVRHVRSPSQDLLPPLLLEKVKGEWVYSDTHLGNELTLVIGQAIDQHENTVLSAQRH